MSNEELEQLAQSEALSIADSSRLEGLVLDQEYLRTGLLNGYKEIIRTKLLQSNPDDQ